MSRKTIKSKSVYCTDCKKETMKLLRVTIPNEMTGYLAGNWRNNRVKVCPDCVAVRSERLTSMIPVANHTTMHKLVELDGHYPSFMLSAQYMAELKLAGKKRLGPK